MFITSGKEEAFSTGRITTTLATPHPADPDQFPACIPAASQQQQSTGFPSLSQAI